MNKLLSIASLWRQREKDRATEQEAKLYVFFRGLYHTWLLCRCGQFLWEVMYSPQSHLQCKPKSQSQSRSQNSYVVIFVFIVFVVARLVCNALDVVWYDCRYHHHLAMQCKVHIQADMSLFLSEASERKKNTSLCEQVLATFYELRITTDCFFAPSRSLTALSFILSLFCVFVVRLELFHSFMLLLSLVVLLLL